jgi:hypothetical protein
MIDNSNEFIKFVKKHLILNKSHNEWNIQIERMNKTGHLSPDTYQYLKQIINT